MTSQTQFRLKAEIECSAYLSRICDPQFSSECLHLLQNPENKQQGIDRDGNAIKLKELVRVPFNSVKGRTVLESFMCQHRKASDKQSEIVLLVSKFLDELYTYLNSTDRRSLQFIYTHSMADLTDAVVFENAAVMLLPKEKYADRKVCAFNPGWMAKTQTDLKTLFGAAWAGVFNHLCFYLYSQLDGELKPERDYFYKVAAEYSALFYKERELCSSLEFDARSFFQLID